MRKLGGLALLVLFAGCADQDVLVDASPHPPDVPGLKPAPCALDSATFRVVSITTPHNNTETLGLAFNLDRDPNQRVDNLLGTIFAAMEERMGPDLDGAASDALASGAVPWVVKVERCADSADGDHARVTLLRGSAYDPRTNTIEVEAGGAVPAVGELVNGRARVEEGIGSVPISAFFDLDAANQPPVWGGALAVGLIFDQGVDADNAIAGRMGFALPADGMTREITSPLARSLATWVTSDPGCPAGCVSGVAAISSEMDLDHDGVISTAELATADLWLALSKPDLDLIADFEGQRVFWPLHDTMNDSVSLGVGFRAIPVNLR